MEAHLYCSGSPSWMNKSAQPCVSLTDYSLCWMTTRDSLSLCFIYSVTEKSYLEVKSWSWPWIYCVTLYNTTFFYPLKIYNKSGNCQKVSTQTPQWEMNPFFFSEMFTVTTYRDWYKISHCLHTKWPRMTFSEDSGFPSQMSGFGYIVMGKLPIWVSSAVAETSNLPESWWRCLLMVTAVQPLQTQVRGKTQGEGFLKGT